MFTTTKPAYINLNLFDTLTNTSRLNFFITVYLRLSKTPPILNFLCLGFDKFTIYHIKKYYVF